MLLSLKAGGNGLNLTAADHVFLLVPWWNPAAEDQAADRAHRHRPGLAPSWCNRLVAEDSVEERILALQEKKRLLADAALAGADPYHGSHTGGVIELTHLVLRTAHTAPVWRGGNGCCSIRYGIR